MTPEIASRIAGSLCFTVGSGCGCAACGSGFCGPCAAGGGVGAGGASMRGCEGGMAGGCVYGQNQYAANATMASSTTITATRSGVMPSPSRSANVASLQGFPCVAPIDCIGPNAIRAPALPARGFADRPFTPGSKGRSAKPRAGRAGARIALGPMQSIGATQGKPCKLATFADREGEGMTPLRVAVIVVLLAIVAFAAYWFWPYTQPPAIPPSQPRIEAPPAPTPPPAAQGPQNPLPQAAQPQPLPTVKQSDPAMRDAISGVIGKDAFERYFIPEQIVHRIVATIDNLPRKSYAQRL